MSENQVKEACLRCQIGTLNGKRGEQLITKCDKFGWRVLKSFASVDVALTDLKGFME